MPRFLSASFASYFFGALTVLADNVAMIETSKFMAPETVTMLVQRASNGGPFGLQVGDTIKYIIKYKPVANGGSTGANGYITDYIPHGLSVTSVGFVQPDGAGGYNEIPPAFAGNMSNDPGGNGNRFFVSPTPGFPATAANTGNLGTLAQLYSDVGVWYSTDTRTQFNPAAPPATSRNNWDLSQLDYENVCANNNGGADGPWGSGSPVAGPETFYQYEVTPPLVQPCVLGNIGPWHRIGVPGARIGIAGLLGDLQASRPLSSADPKYGRNLSVSPLPVSTAATPVTIRWANGLNSVGEVKYVTVSALVAFLPPNGALINQSEVWGGDVYYGEGGKDNPWKYNKTKVSIANNSAMTISKQPSVERAAEGDVVSFQITVINTGTLQHSNISVVDYVNTSHEPGKPNKLAVMVQYNNDASVGGVYTPGPPGELIGSEHIIWNIPVLNPGASQTFTYSVTALAAPNRKIQDAADKVVVTSDQLPIGGTSTSASFTLGLTPILNQTKTVSPSTILAGDTVRYHIQIKNTGGAYAGTYHTTPFPGTTYYPVDLLGAPRVTTIIDTLPTGFVYAGNPVQTINGIPIVGSTVTVLGNEITWSIPHTLATANELPPDATLDIFFDALSSASIPPGIYVNSVQSEIPYNKKPKNKAPKDKDWAVKPISTLNAAPVSVGAVQISKSTSTSAVVNSVSGSNATYTITVTNNGPTDAFNVAVTDTLPLGFTYQALSTSGSAGVGEPSVAGQNVVWPSMTVPALAQRTITFVADISSSVTPAVYYNDISATSSNNTIPDALQTAPVVISAPGLSVTSAVDRPTIPWLGGGLTAPPNATDIVNYTITLSNSGSGYSVVTVSDQLPSGFEYDPILGLEVVVLSTGGTQTTLARGAVDGSTIYSVYPQLPILLPTRTPQWGVFTIPPAQNGIDSTLTITFPVRINMAENPQIGVAAISAPGTYNNQVTVSGNSVLPIFIGSPVEIYRPVSVLTTTPTVAVNGLINYRIQVDNRDIINWSAVNLANYLGALTTANNPPTIPSNVSFVPGSAYYAVGVSAPLGAPGIDPGWITTSPTVALPILNFNHLGAGFAIPGGSKLFIAYTVNAPPVVPAPSLVHNSVQSLNYVANLQSRSLLDPFDGGSLTNSADDTLITASPTIALTTTKTASPSSVYLNGAQGLSVVTYTITMTNPDPSVVATGITLTDQLPAGFYFDATDTASISVNGNPPQGLTTIWTVPNLSIDFGATQIPPNGTAVVTFTASINAATPANTYFNTLSWIGNNVGLGNTGPVAPVILDPVNVSKITTSPIAVVGGFADYRITITNIGTDFLNALVVTDYPGGLTPALTPNGFTYAATTQVTLNGAPLLSGTNFVAPVLGSPSPSWNFSSLIPAASAIAPSILIIDFSMAIPTGTVPGTYNNSISSLSFSPGALPPINLSNPFDGAVPSNTADDVVVSSVGITKSVIPPFSTVGNNPLTGTSTRYQIIVNNSSALAQTVQVEDVLPLGFSLAASSSYFAFGNVPPNLVPPSAGWTTTIANTTLPNSVVKPLYDNGGAGFSIPANQNLYLYFSVNISGGVFAGVYSNFTSVRLQAAPTVIVNTFTGANVTVQSAQAFLTKTTSTPTIGKDALGSYQSAKYKISVLNIGSVVATGIIVNDNLPIGFTLLPGVTVITNNGVIVPPSNYTITQIGQNVVFDTVPTGGFSVVAASGGVSGHLDIEYDTSILNTTPSGIVTNSASATTTNAGALAPVNIPITLVDLGLSKSTTTPNVISGTTASYTIQVNNYSLTPQANVLVTDYLPVGFNYVAATTGSGWVPTEPNLVNGYPQWLIPSIPASTTVNLTFSVNVDSLVSAGTYFNSVSAVAGPIVFPPTGPTAPVVAQPGVPNIVITYSADSIAVLPGQIVTYTIQVTNAGNAEATSVQLTEEIGDFLVFGLDSFGVGLPFNFVDGIPTSTLTMGTPVFSNDGGQTFSYSVLSTGGGALPGFDANVSNWRIPMLGTMPASGTFNIQLKEQVH